MNRIQSFIHYLNESKKHQMNHNCFMALMLSITTLLTSCDTVAESASINYLPPESSTVFELETPIKTDPSILYGSDDFFANTDNTKLKREESEASTPENSSLREEDSSITYDCTDTENKDAELIAYPPCRAAALYCMEDSKLLYSDSTETMTAPASLTNLLTAAVTLKYMNPDDIVTVGSEQRFVNEGSSICGLSVGNRLTVEDLITGMLMSSGNDAAYTAAVSTARAAYPDIQMNDTAAVYCFCGLMNKFAVNIGMTESYFVNPDGWDDPEQYTTVEDLIDLAEYVYSISEIRTIISTYHKTVCFESGEVVSWTNSNKLLDPNSSYYNKYAVGMKTGTTQNAGDCLIAAFQKENKSYFSVVVGCNSDEDRYKFTRNLYSFIA